MKTPPFLRALWLAAGLGLALGLTRGVVLEWLSRSRELPRLDGATGQPWIGGDFAVGRGFASIAAGLLPAGTETASSGVYGDAWQGRVATAWFRAKPSLIHVAVAGYPRHAGCELWAEFRDAGGAVTRVDCPVADPCERWNVWEIRRPADAVAVRLVAQDRAADAFGWLAFSHPFRAAPGWITAVFLHLQLLAAVALVLTLVWGPGLLWSPRAAAPEIRTLFLIGAGPLLLVALGVLIWCAGGAVRPGPFGVGIVAALWLALGATAWRRGFALEVDGPQRRALALSALIVVAVVAKSAYSAGPEGELYRGTVSRNLTVGDRIDARFPFYVVQAAARHLGPAAPAAEKYFFPWTFFSRGPLAGLAAIPVVFATGGRPPVELPEQRWSPFDREGFAAYRVTMIALASGIIVAVAALLVPLVGERWALLGAGLLALSPFGVHEVMFTWPKWAATAWLVMSFSLGHARRPLAAGLALGVGFLFHPLVLLWMPWLALWAVGRAAGTSLDDARGRRPAAPLRVAAALARFGCGAALLVLPWMAAGALAPHLSDTPFAGQGDFLRYWRIADRTEATWATWWHTRWMNFANTFVPLHVVLSDESYHHFRADSPYGPSPPLVKFALVWWNSLPFGAGLGLWALGLVALCRAVVSLRAALALFAIGPALMMTAYWGMDPLGLMRECGHPLLVGFVVILCIVATREGGWLQRVLLHPAVPWLQLPETWLMLWLTTLANRAPWSVEFPQLDPLCLALNALALALAAWVLSRARGEPPA